MKVLGIDPGTASTGFGFVEADGPDGAVVHSYGVIRTAPRTPMPDRLLVLHRDLAALIDELRPDAVAVEELFFSNNARTAMSVGQARGVILLTAAAAGLTVAEYKPNEVKLALTGDGRADKRQMQDMLQILLHLDEPPHPDDAADGIAVALCHLRMARIRELSGEA